jgi:hypothetical protein
MSTVRRLDQHRMLGAVREFLTNEVAGQIPEIGMEGLLKL